MVEIAHYHSKSRGSAFSTSPYLEKEVFIMDIRIVDKTRATDTFQKLPRGSRILLNGILKHCTNKRLWASQKTMSEWSQDFGGLSIPAIKRHLPVLEESGFLVEIPTPSNTNNAYTIILLPEVDTNDPPLDHNELPLDHNEPQYPTKNPTKDPTCISEEIQINSDPANAGITNTDPLEPLILPDIVQDKYIPPVPVDESLAESIQSINPDQEQVKLEFVDDRFVEKLIGIVDITHTTPQHIIDSKSKSIPVSVSPEPEIDIFEASKERYRQEIIALRKQQGIIVDTGDT